MAPESSFIHAPSNPYTSPQTGRFISAQDILCRDPLVDKDRSSLVQNLIEFRVRSSGNLCVNRPKGMVCGMALPNERVKYSAIVDRPKLRLPNGERIIAWTIANVEGWDISRPIPRQVLQQ